MTPPTAKVSSRKLAELSRALDYLKDHPEAARLLVPSFYTADGKLSRKINRLGRYVNASSLSAKQSAKAGVLLEQVAYLAFRGLSGVEVIKSYTSAGPQIDLLVNGDNDVWFRLCEFLRVGVLRRGMLVEAKATREKVGDPIFARLCSVLADNFPKTVALGVFFTLRGATGFPVRGAAQKQSRVGDARLRQVMFYARTGTPVVVFDWDDIKSLVNPGVLPKLLADKIREIEELSEMPPQQLGSCVIKEDRELPDHLRGL